MKIKLLRSESRAPHKAHKSDAGYDLYTPEEFVLKPNSFKKIKLGIAIEIEQDEVAIVQGRSGLAFKHGITTIGNIIDSGYRGEIGCCLLNHSSEEITFKQHDRIAQLLIVKLSTNESKIVDNLSNSDRGKSGFGSTGL